MNIVKAALLLVVLMLAGCCTEYGTLLWSGSCAMLPPTPEAIEAERFEHHYQAYEKRREKKVVKGLGGAMYHRDGY